MKKILYLIEIVNVKNIWQNFLATLFAKTEIAKTNVAKSWKT